MGVSPIVYELGLVVGGLVIFVVWQTVTLRRDMRITRERSEREAADAPGTRPPGGPPARKGVEKP